MTDRILLIDKPYRWTSFDVIRKIRKPLLEEKKRETGNASLKRFKVGHAGTLDPLATGLLIVCSGRFTKDIPRIQEEEKEYKGTLVLGATTESYDLETQPGNFLPYEHISEKEVLEAANSLTGDQMQMPPIHSAKKIEGKRAYELARSGEVFDLKPNRVHIRSFTITNFRLPEIDFSVVCSKGTYIRSLANDLGAKLGTGAYLSALCRVRIGTYYLDQALTPDQFLLHLAEKQPIK